jgi:hypothetical protein
MTLQLMKVLSNRNFAHIITWMPSGRSFSILKPKLFATEILPDHFKSAKYSSFTRKMHRWGFMRHYRGEESGAFYHKDFQKDRLDLVEKMACQKAIEPYKASSFAMKVESAPTKDSRPSKKTVPASSTPSSSSGVSNHGPIDSMSKFQDLRRQQVVPIARPTHGPMTRMPLPVQPPIVASLGMASHSSQPVRTVAMFTPMGMQQTLRSEMPVPTPESIVAAEINAAIEMEVSRRLQQRISAAAAHMSRANVARMGSMLQPPSAMNALNDSASALRNKLMQMQQQKEQMQYLYMTGSLPVPAQGLGELPRTNIQGAKTA